MIDPFDRLLSLAVAMVRVSALIYVLPFSPSASVGRFLRLPLAVAIAMCVLPPGISLEVSLAATIALVVKEALVGAWLGLMLARLFIVASAAGALIDHHAGYTMGGTFNPNLGASTGPIESLYGILLTFVLLGGAGAFVLAKAIIATYVVWPIGHFYPPVPDVESFLLRTLTDGSGELIALCLHMAMPALALVLFSDLCIATMSRLSQQLNPLAMSMAVKAMICALVMLLALPGSMNEIHVLIARLLRVQ
jgi:type III secretion protein T